LESQSRKVEVAVDIYPERKYDGQFKVVFDAIREQMTPPVKEKRKIGFK
jgi:hypothetical protein